jgi:hypothetical protein
MLIVDAQIHLWEKGTPSAHRQGPYSAEQAITGMDEAGVDRALIHPVCGAQGVAKRYAQLNRPNRAGENFDPELVGRGKDCDLRAGSDRHVRAFTTAAVALANGPPRIIMVGTVDEALALRAAESGTICMGEVRGQVPNAFDYGNSGAFGEWTARCRPPKDRSIPRAKPEQPLGGARPSQADRADLQVVGSRAAPAMRGSRHWQLSVDSGRSRDHYRIAGRSQAIEDRLPILVAGEIVVDDEELANAGLSAIPGEGDIHAPILRLSLGRVVRCNGARLPEALSRQQVGIYTFRREINHHARRSLAREVEIV